jgi:hypothetical protein
MSQFKDTKVSSVTSLQEHDRLFYDSERANSMK